jgi:hypothetical protein
VISIVQLIKKCSVSDALKYLSQFVCITEKSSSKKLTIKRENYRIIKVQEVKHPTLVDYLKFRKVFEQKDLVKEVYYEMGGKQYFGIGFENQSGDLKFVILIQKSVLAKKILHSFNRIQKVLKSQFLKVFRLSHFPKFGEKPKLNLRLFNFEFYFNAI